MRVYFDRRGRYRGSSISLGGYLLAIIVLIVIAVAYWQVTVVLAAIWLAGVIVKHRQNGA